MDSEDVYLTEARGVTASRVFRLGGAVSCPPFPFALRTSAGTRSGCRATGSRADPTLPARRAMSTGPRHRVGRWSLCAASGLSWGDGWMRPGICPFLTPRKKMLPLDTPEQQFYGRATGSVPDPPRGYCPNKPTSHAEILYLRIVTSQPQAEACCRATSSAAAPGSAFRLLWGTEHACPDKAAGRR